MQKIIFDLVIDLKLTWDCTPGYYSLANKTSANNVSIFEKFSDKSNLDFQPRLSAGIVK